MPKIKDLKKESSEETLNEVYKQEIQAPPKNKSFIEIRIIIFCLIISFLSGLVAAFVKDLLVDGNPVVITPETSVKEKTVVPDLEFLLSKEDEASSGVLSQLRSQIVGFYRKKKTQEILPSLYLEKDFLGSGVIITSDGWLLTHQQVIDKEDFIVITADKKILEPLKTVKDPFSGAVLVQVSAKDLNPVKFADINYSQVTDPLLTVRYSAQNHGSDIVKTAIQRFAYHDQVKPLDFLLSTEKIDHYIKIADNLEMVYNGAALFNSKSELIGLLFESGREQIRLAVPAYYLKSAVNNFLSSAGEVLRSNFGVSYLDLSEALGLPAAVAENRVKGAVLLGSVEQNIMAVKEGSPAQNAGLKAGDIVLRVNNEEINENHSLTQLVQEYTPGQEISLTIVRDGKEAIVKVVLGEL